MKKDKYFRLCSDGKNKFVDEIDGYIYTEPTTGTQYGVYYNRDVKEWKVTHLPTGLLVDDYNHLLSTEAAMRMYLAEVSKTVERIAGKHKETQELFAQLVKEYNDGKGNNGH